MYVQRYQRGRPWLFNGMFGIFLYPRSEDLFSFLPMVRVSRRWIIQRSYLGDRELRRYWLFLFGWGLWAVGIYVGTCKVKPYNDDIPYGTSGD